MTAPRRGTRSSARRRSAPSIRPSQLLVMAVVLAIFVTGLVVAGILGALLVGLLVVAAGVWLVLRWRALPERVRIFRAGVVLVGVAVAVSLLYR